MEKGVCLPERKKIPRCPVPIYPTLPRLSASPRYSGLLFAFHIGRHFRIVVGRVRVRAFHVRRTRRRGIKSLVVDISWQKQVLIDRRCRHGRFGKAERSQGGRLDRSRIAWGVAIGLLVSATFSSSGEDGQTYADDNG